MPLSARSAPTVEIRGEVEYPELSETAVRIVRQELLRHHPEGRVEVGIFAGSPEAAGPRLSRRRRFRVARLSRVCATETSRVSVHCVEIQVGDRKQPMTAENERRTHRVRNGDNAE